MTHSEGESLKDSVVGAVGCCSECYCPMLEGCQKINELEVFSSNGAVFSVRGFCHLAL